MLSSLLLTLLLAAVQERAPVLPPSLTPRLAFERTRYQGLTISPDGMRVVTLRERPQSTTHWEAHSLVVHDVSLGRTVHHELPAGRYGYFRWDDSGQTLAFLHWGKNFTEVWTLGPDGAPPMRALPESATFQAFELDWPRGALKREGHQDLLVVHTASGPRGRGTRVTRFDLESNEDRGELCFLQRYFVKEVTISSRGDRIAFITTESSAYGPDGGPADLGVLDLETQQLTLWTDGRGIASRPAWSPDGSALAFLWNPRPELISIVHRELQLLDLDRGEVQRLTADYPFSIGNGIYGTDESLWFTPDGKEVITATQCAMEDQLLTVNVDTGRWRWATAGPYSFKQLAFARSAPRGVCVQSGPGVPERVVQVTEGALEILERPNAALESLALSSFERRRIPCEDGSFMESLLLTPNGEKPPFPLILLLHGGSSGRHTLRFNESYSQVFAGLGYAVLLPNPRGSSGYDLAFSLGNEGDFGGREVDDLLLAVEELIANGIADPARCYAYGHSYGGFLAQLLTARSNQFRAAASAAGVSDWKEFYSSSDLSSLAVLGLGGTPEERPDRYRLRSPLQQVEHMRTPLLLIHGSQDVRVPISQSRTLLEALQARDVDSHIVVLSGQGHTYQELGATDRWVQAVHEWFVEHGAND